MIEYEREPCYIKSVSHGRNCCCGAVVGMRLQASEVNWSFLVAALCVMLQLQIMSAGDWGWGQAPYSMDMNCGHVFTSLQRPLICVAAVWLLMWFICNFPAFLIQMDATLPPVQRLVVPTATPVSGNRSVSFRPSLTPGGVTRPLEKTPVETVRITILKKKQKLTCSLFALISHKYKHVHHDKNFFSFVSFS